MVICNKTIKDIWQRAKEILIDGGVENAVFECNVIVRTVLGIDALEIMRKFNDVISNKAADTIITYAERRTSGEPLEYILGTQEFMSLEFDVNEHTLIPRQDTETLVEQAIKVCGDFKDKIRVLDIGAGSGCVGISIAYYASNTDVTELDMSDDILKTVKTNAEKNGVEYSVHCVKCDILKDIPSCGSFDIIVSNPPYIRTDVIPTLEENVRNFEPITALDGGEDGLIFYREIVKKADTLLKENGVLLFEIGYDQGNDVSDIMKSNGFSEVEVIKDLCGNDRVVKGRKSVV